MTGAQILVAALEKNGVHHMFAYPGAANCPLFDALADSEIKTILPRSEQAAAHMASGYAKASGSAGVCCATSGPGATNLITGIATAYMDSVPMVIITGQVSSNLVGKDAFQEVDITGATTPFTKHNYLVTSVHEIEDIVNSAFYIANTGRPGPVLIDIPIDIQAAELLHSKSQSSGSIRGYKFFDTPNELQIKRAAGAIIASKRPVFLIGGGSVISGASSVLRKLLEDTQIPAVSTMNGLGVIPSQSRCFFGMVGVHGKAAANAAIDEADLVIALGARLGDRSFGNFSLPEKSQQLIHVDIDPAEIGKSIQPSIPIVGDIKNFATSLSLQLCDYKASDTWLKKLEQLNKSEEPSLIGDFVNPKYFIKCLSSQAGNSFIATEVGQNQIWTVNNYDFCESGKLILSAGLGTMGYGLSAAIGARAASGERVIAILGDGSFQMNLPELATIMQWQLPVKMVLFNNNCLGMVRELQKRGYSGKTICTDLGNCPDFCKLAEAYGINAERISSNEQIPSAINRLLSGDRPYFLEVCVSIDETTV